MLVRVVVGIILLVFTIGLGLFARQYSLYYSDIVIMCFLYPSVYEIVMSLKKGGYKPILPAIIFGTVAVYPVLIGFKELNKPSIMEVGLFIVIAVSALTALIFFTFDKKYESKDLLATFFVLIYPLMLFSLFFIINHQTGDLLGIMMVLFYSVITDTFAYFFGVTIKGKKLCPSISPKKTVAGAIGGLFGGLVTSIILFLVYDYFNLFANVSNVRIFRLYDNLYISLAIYLVFGLFAAVAAELGDLAASRIKRTVGIKDFGHLFPGHGGVLDRIDSFIFILPMVYILFKILEIVA